MKAPTLLAITCLGALSLGQTALASDSKRTADYLLSSALANEGKEVTLDVSFVEPVHWQSPIPEIAFFHAITIDRSDRKPGGRILVAVPAANSAAFAKKYGTDFKGRTETTPLKGIFTLAGGGGDRPGPVAEPSASPATGTGARPGPGPRPGLKIWIVDATDGLLQQAIAAKKLHLPPEAEGAGGPGGGHRPFRNPQN